MFSRASGPPAREPLAHLSQLLLLTLLTGCGAGHLATSNPIGSATSLTGHVVGGQQPVTGATIQLYAAGLTSIASTATPLLTRSVLTDSNGNFTITGDYTCPSNSAPVYIVATGGNPGLSGNVTNSALTLVTTLGNCANLTSSTFINLNEVTTAAAAWALAPFAQSATQLGAPSTNLTGLNNAFLTAGNLAESSTGLSPGVNLPAGAAVNSSKIYALANILATCVNSSGGTPCTSLFSTATPPSSTPPTDTFQATLSIVTHPSNNVAALFNLIPPTPPFAVGLATAPSDWTLFIKFKNGGMSAPSSLDVDASGNIWVANYFGSASVFSSTGAPIFASGITGSGLQHSYGLAIDAQNNAWITNEDSSSAVNHKLGSISVINSSGQPVSGPDGFTTGGLNYPVAIAIDTNNTAWVVNYGNASVTLLDSSGASLSGATGYGSSHLLFPIAVAVDASHNAWIANQSGNTVTRISPDGASITDFACCDGAAGVAIDQNANVWVANYYGNSISQISGTGAIISNGSYTGNSINHPQGIAIDGAGSVWVASFRGPSLTQLAGSTATSPGAALSPASGWAPDANLVEAFDLAVDASGSIWVTGFGDDTLTQFVGIATPIKTPRLGPPQLP
jgi:hypothetical protein